MKKEKLKTNRRDFCNIINEKNYQIGVEIGLGFGSYSEYLLKNSKLEKLYSIDPFDSTTAEFYDGLKSTKQKLLPFSDRSTFIRKTSKDAVIDFEDGSLDFIYIDGDHRTEFVKEDMILWYPKLKMGGFFSGHDYDHSQQGLVDVVNEFCESFNIETLYITSTTNLPMRKSAAEDVEGGMEEQVSSWFFYKKENNG